MEWQDGGGGGEGGIDELDWAPGSKSHLLRLFGIKIHYKVIHIIKLDIAYFAPALYVEFPFP